MQNINQQTAIIIPIRMSSTRLPGKFHALIDGKKMIEHVIDRARESGFTNIFVACDHQDHFDVVQDYGCQAILTSVDHQSGSDRVFEALKLIDPEHKFKYIINLQGDMPFFDNDNIKQVVTMLAADAKCDIATLAALIDDYDDVNNINVVKVVFDKNYYALYFSRLSIPFCKDHSKANYYYHVGLYGFKRDAIEKFINLPQSDYELAEKLEQLRALENGMKIKVGICKEVPISVDVPEDLIFADQYAKKQYL